MYRPPPTWQVWAAFGGAVAIMSISVVIAGIHPEPPPVEDLSQIPEAVSAVLEQEPAPPEPTPPPEEPDIPPPPPPPEAQPEFQRRTTNATSAATEDKTRHPAADSPADFRRRPDLFPCLRQKRRRYFPRDLNIPTKRVGRKKPVAAFASLRLIRAEA